MAAEAFTFQESDRVGEVLLRFVSDTEDFERYRGQHPYVSIGGIVPLLLKRADQDPAAASGPLLTTITDMAGFFLVLSLASALMPFLV